MTEIAIVATSSSLAINNVVWTEAPQTAELCRALQVDDPLDGDYVIIGRKPDSQFRYFDSLGISILETVGGLRAKRISVHFRAKDEVKKALSPYGTGGQRATISAFQGSLHLNGRELRRPLHSRHFPASGDLNFIHRIAVGPVLSAAVDMGSQFVETVSFEFRCSE